MGIAATEPRGCRGRLTISITGFQSLSNDHINFYQYWGKTNKKEDNKKGDSYHLLPYHSLDVAAVGYCLLDPEKDLCCNLARRLEVEPEWLRDWFCFCLMLHDLGKFFRAFQNLVQDQSPSLVPYFAGCTYRYRHDSLGFCLWNKILFKRLSDIFPAEVKTSISGWLEVVCGHHGQPPNKSIKGLTTFLMEEDELAAEEFVREIIRFWLPDIEPLSKIQEAEFRSASWQLAGLAVLADWLGSDQSVFKYKADEQSLSEYWENTALPKAKEVLKQSSFKPKKVAPYQSIQQQFPFIKIPTPLQTYSEKVCITNDPQLFLLEDVTGAGKTEAAMILVHRLMDAALADGLYVGLPTMATANAMFERLGKCYRALYSAEVWPSLVLAHGASHLSEGFQDSIALEEQTSDRDYSQDDFSATAYCNAWLADNRKKALLADVGIGTIDQALLAILPAKHQSLRLLGLTDKVLLIDEVHAYDPYMQVLLNDLLKTHASQGGSAILLSATLPKTMRAQLLASFAEGRGMEVPALQKKQDYPLVTRLSDSEFNEVPVNTRRSVERTVNVIRLADEQEAINLIKENVALGRCICWIRNTVQDARNAYQELKQQDWIERKKLTMFHSRFAMIDRQAIEKDVLQRFGKTSTRRQRQAQVLIATQVVEQSLDLDFDIIISDLAPIDLLIQRAGRLHRHCRENNGDCIHDPNAQDQRDPPCLYLLSPDPNKVENKNWLRTLLPGTQAVYANVGQLWLTIRVILNNENSFSMPQDARHLIESVYGDNASNDIPEVLDEASFEASAEQKSQRGMGKFNTLDMDQGYTLNSARQSAGWDDDVNIPTRLTGDSVSLILVVPEQNMLKPYAQHKKHAWPLSKINVPKHEWEKAQQLISPEWLAVVDKLKLEHSFLKWQDILPLTADTEHFYSPEDGWDLNRR